MRILVLSLLLFSGLAHADANERFVRYRNAAEALGGLGTFLDRYVGGCDDPFAHAECASRAQKFRREVAGKKFYMIISEDSASMLSPGPYDPATGTFTINITPFFPASAYALTHGKPKSTDGSGNPVMPFLQVRGQVPEGETQSSIARMFRTRAFRLQVVFTPQSLWTLPQKGGGRSVGVQAKIHAILVTNGRTGEEVGLWENGGR